MGGPVGPRPDGQLNVAVSRSRRSQPIELPGRWVALDDRAEREAGANFHLVQGTYGDYLLNKVEKGFPQLRQSVFSAAHDE